MTANRFLNNQEYANTMLLLLENNLVHGQLVDGRFKNEVTDKNGLSVSVKRTPQFAPNKQSILSGTAATLQKQDILTGSVNVAVDQYAKVHIGVGDIEYVQSYNELMRNKVMKAAASRLAHDIDLHIAAQTLGFYSHVGDMGQPFHSALEFNPLHTRLMEMSVPPSDLAGVVTYADGEKIRGNLIGSNIDNVNRTALERARIPILSEVDLYASQNTPLLITGTRTTSSASQVDGASENVSYRTESVRTTYTQTLSVKGLTNGHTIKAGEVFNIADVYGYDPFAQQALEYEQDFTVVEDVTVVGTTADITISPPIIVPGTSDGVDTNGNTAFATVDSVPADSAAITWKGAASTRYKQRYAFHKGAITLVSAQLTAPFTGEYSFAMSEDTGIAVRYWRGSDIETGEHIHRWDCIFGAKLVDPRLGTRGNGLTPA